MRPTIVVTSVMAVALAGGVVMSTGATHKHGFTRVAQEASTDTVHGSSDTVKGSDSRSSSGK
jgi:hypothetical protein